MASGWKCRRNLKVRSSVCAEYLVLLPSQLYKVCQLGIVDRLRLLTRENESDMCGSTLFKIMKHYHAKATIWSFVFMD